MVRLFTKAPPEQSRSAHRECLNLKPPLLEMKAVFSKKLIVKQKFQRFEITTLP